MAQRGVFDKLISVGSILHAVLLSISAMSWLDV